MTLAGVLACACVVDLGNEGATPPGTKPPVLAPGHAMPTYPEELRAQGVEGRVSFRVKVTKTGKLRYIQLVESTGPEAFDASAKAALVKWEFEPATVDGKPRAVWWMVHFPFVLDRD